MIRDFDKQLMLKNIDYLIAKNGMKIGELEKAANVSPGYISRMRDASSSKPGIEFVMNLADALGVSLDTFVKVNMSELTATERYLQDFLQTLIDETSYGRLEWIRETADYLNNRLQTNQYERCEHRLFEVATVSDNPGGDFARITQKPIFTSHAFEIYTKIHGDCFKLEMNDDVELYIMDIEKSIPKGTTSDNCVKEIWMCPVIESSQYLCDDKGALGGMVNALYYEVFEALQHPKIRSDIKRYIDDFIKETTNNFPF